jgi:hypothetical protein
MDGEGIRVPVIRISTRSLMLVAAVCVPLLLVGLWSVRQSRLAQEALARALAAERAAARAAAEAERVRTQLQGPPARDGAVARASRHRDAKEVERVRQLYNELNSLSRIQEHIADDLRGPRDRTKAKAVP